MRGRTMSSGTTVGMGWLLADQLDDEQRAVCAPARRRRRPPRPRRSRPGARHFAAQIKTARARHRDQPYRELLAEVLDYRQLAAHSRSCWSARRAARSGSPAPGTAGCPAVSSPCRCTCRCSPPRTPCLNSADPHGPRLLALDEAFAGMDDTGRGELCRWRPSSTSTCS